MTIAVLIQYLLVVLLGVSIIAVLRLWSVLGSVRVTLANLETTRNEVTETVKRLDEAVAGADRLLREEVTPTLQVARATLTNVEVTTRALAETTTSLRRITGKAATANDARQLITAGTTLARAMARKKQEGTAKSPARSLLSAVGAGIVGLFTRGRKVSDDRSPQAPAESAAQRALPAEVNSRRRSPRVAPLAPDAERNAEELHR